jgi:TatD DNase family protein
MKVADEIERAGAYVLSVTTTPKAFPRTVQIAKGKKRIRTALGLHPQLVHERHGEIGMFVRLLGETEYVGEVGIDGGDDFARHLDVQKDVFDRILLACSAVGGRIISIHSRHASGEVLEALSRHRSSGVAVLHWFSGPAAHAERATELGAWFSVGLPMVRSRRAASLLSKLPRDRVLTETDAPFASTNGAHFPTTAVTDTVLALARLWNCDPRSAQKQLNENLRNLSIKAAAFKAQNLTQTLV